jgi:uncharacterized membrane protein
MKLGSDNRIIRIVLAVILVAVTYKGSLNTLELDLALYLIAALLLITGMAGRSLLGMLPRQKQKIVEN